MIYCQRGVGIQTQASPGCLNLSLAWSWASHPFQWGRPRLYSSLRPSSFRPLPTPRLSPSTARVIASICPACLLLFLGIVATAHKAESPPQATAGKGRGSVVLVSEPGNLPTSLLPVVSGLERIPTFAVPCSVSARGTPPRPHLVPLWLLAWPRRRDAGHALVMGDAWNYWQCSLEGPVALGMGKQSYSYFTHRAGEKRCLFLPCCKIKCTREAHSTPVSPWAGREAS